MMTLLNSRCAIGIDSARKVDDSENVHLTHVGCNLAKSFASIQEWEDYLDVLRAAQGTHVRPE